MAVGRLWTSAEAASAFRVGVSSIKRWTDEGELDSVRTPGGHRRYTIDALHRFASIRNLPVDFLPPPEARVLAPDMTLFEALIRGDAEAVRTLVTPPLDGIAQRAAFFDRVAGDALREIGDRWECGQLGVDQEHRASQMLAEAADRLRPAAREGRLALLACPPDEWHDLPLRFVRLLLEWSGWRTVLIGANLPWNAAFEAVDRDRPALVGFSSRSSEPYRAPEFAQLSAHCAARGARIVAGGAWARGGAASNHEYLRFRSLRGFERWLRVGQQG